jgi:hypothetical protein
LDSNLFGSFASLSQIFVSFMTRPPDEAQLVGLVYSLTKRLQEDHLPWYQKPIFLGGAVLVATVLLNVIFR